MKVFSDDDREYIYSLALEGLSDNEIADIYYVETRAINALIKRLIDPHCTYRDEELYGRILMARAIRNKPIIDKDLLDNIVKMVFEGYMDIEIACLLGIDGKTIIKYINYLKNKSVGFYDILLYNEVMLKRQKNHNQDLEVIFKKLEKVESDYEGVDLRKICSLGIIKRYYVYKKYKTLIKIYLDSNMTLTDVDLAIRLGISSSDVTTFFNQTGGYYFMLVDEETRKKIALKRIEKNQVILKKNQDFDISSKGTLKDSKLFCDLRNNPVFWLKFILTFRLSINDFASIIDCENVLELRLLLISMADSLSVTYKKALLFLFTVASDNEENVRRANDWLVSYKRVRKQKKEYPEEYRRIVGIIYDFSYSRILKEGKTFKTMSDEEKRAVIEFKIKYALPSRLLPFHISSIRKSVPKDLQGEYDSLISFTSDTMHFALQNDNAVKKNEDILIRKYVNENGLNKSNFHLY